jgi:hypothetical protein
VRLGGWLGCYILLLLDCLEQATHVKGMVGTSREVLGPWTDFL